MQGHLAVAPANFSMAPGYMLSGQYVAFVAFIRSVDSGAYNAQCYPKLLPRP